MRPHKPWGKRSSLHFEPRQMAIYLEGGVHSPGPSTPSAMGSGTPRPGMSENFVPAPPSPLRPIKTGLSADYLDLCFSLINLFLTGDVENGIYTSPTG